MERQSGDGLKLVRRDPQGGNAVGGGVLDGFSIPLVMPQDTISIGISEAIGELVEGAVRAGDSKGFRPALRLQAQQVMKPYLKDESFLFRGVAGW